MKKIILGFLKWIESLCIRFEMLFNEEFRFLKSDGRKIVFLDLPTHGNLGDQAIAVAEKDFLQKKYPECRIVTFTKGECEFCLERIKKYITDDDYLFLPGGGFIGSLWMGEQKVIEKILVEFSNNFICIFPHTVYFSDESIAAGMFDGFIRIVNSTKKLVFCVRDEKSYALLKDRVKCKLFLFPDIVLSYKYKNTNSKRNGKALLCFRTDIEKIIDTDYVKSYLNVNGVLYDETSTVLKKSIKPSLARIACDKKLQEFSEYSIVICDRLHALIFAYLTQTPCIAFDNVSGKVRGVYKWLSARKNIVCLKKLTDFNVDIMRDIINSSQTTNNTNDIISFDGLYNVLKEYYTRGDMRMKRFIDIYVPVETCNFRCHYCYIVQTRAFNAKLPEFSYDAEYIGKALSKERLGGIAHMNICGGGETLLPPEMPKIILELLQQGHYLFVVTNGSLFKRFDEILEIVPKKLLSHLGFKFSFHYLELKRLNLLEKYFANINRVWDAGCSFSLELTPNDELIQLIPEIQKVCMEKVGALCHISVARDDQKPDYPILSKLSRDEYIKTWGQFNSPFFSFKMSTFNIKRKEFCYAGAWSGYLDLGSGLLRQCYFGKYQNIYEDISKAIDFTHCVGNNCEEPHCFNSHAFLTVGLIPELETPFYAEMRNRKTEDGREWLSAEMKEFLRHQLCEENELYTDKEKRKYANKMDLLSKPKLVAARILKPYYYKVKKRIE